MHARRIVLPAIPFRRLGIASGLLVVVAGLTACSTAPVVAGPSPAASSPAASSIATTVAPGKAKAEKPAGVATTTVTPPALAPVPIAKVPDAGVAPPVTIAIPALEIDQDLVGLRVNRADGSLTAPTEWNDIGWWSGGPAPGADGAAVIAGHVDTKTGPAIFAGLGSLKNKAKVTITRADGSVAVFEVYKTKYFDRNHFPNDVVYRETGPSELHLVTCTGPYDRSAQEYTQNYVVFAKLVHDTMKRS